MVQERVMRESSGTVTVIYPTLTNTNYTERALVMHVNLQVIGLWEAIDPGDASFRDDRMALSAILRAVPPDMLATLAVKDTAKQAWDAIELMSIGVERVREAIAQKLRKELEDISFKDGESVDAFAMRITGLVNNLCTLGDAIVEEKVVKKFLQVVLPRYTQVAIAIEMLLDLSTMTIEELTGPLRSVEQRYGLDDDNAQELGSRLLLTEEWAAPVRQREQARGSSDDGQNDNRGHETKDGGNFGERDMTKVKCYKCNKMGHFSRDCRAPRRERKERANLVEVDDDEPALLLARASTLDDEVPALLMAHVSTITKITTGATEHVTLNEERAQVLGTGASNHMTGYKSVDGMTPYEA